MYGKGAIKEYMSDEKTKSERRKLDKFVTLNLQQISALQTQVGEC